MSSHLAVFDLDETLVSADSMALWHQYLLDKNLTQDPDFMVKDEAFMRDYSAGTLDLPEYLAFSLSPLTNMDAKDVDALATQFAQEIIPPFVFEEARTTLAELKECEAEVVIVSASLAFLVKPIAKMLGVDNAMGIELKTQQGMYIPEPDGEPTFREGKVFKLTEWIYSLEHDFEHVSFYTDSINDLPMCFFADSVNVVNPCKKLLTKAIEYQWPVLRWGTTEGVFVD
ncbi:HAD family hydrolase [Enterovibrio nigricans]|uniref:HAD-superfamily subfamily IB hydrolase, TIGR01490 n=1 Tax=Enterovibrio nigricans DSM 22720 TaxID=1121868 RepID=A0A1T4VK47_9GAMM|nr:HAD family hydrolase [Enterovibrio nigricans]PKF49641.1 HAD-IB family hydrolase [Enterovibrio nigricans]SKA65265.1 HAD-superfamily subfamily IB hydrolase, TIGR01490 [Enterovibrio nigricans DSM 22720]